MSNYTPYIVPLSEHYGISPDVFEKLGVLNIPLTADAPLFIDPQLLKNSQFKIFSETAWNDYQAYYTQLMEKVKAIHMLDGVRKQRAKALAQQFIVASEPKGLCLGYSKNSNRGRGVGKEVSKIILDSALDIVDIGIDNHNIFSVVFLLERGIGADLISDLTANIIINSLCAFTAQIALKLKIKTKPYLVAGKRYLLPKHPFEKSYLLFVPTDIVNRLPIDGNLPEVLHTFMEGMPSTTNDEIRYKVNEEIGRILAEARLNKRTGAQIKDLLKQYIYKNADAVYEFMEAINNTEAQPVDMENEFAEFTIPYEFGKYYNAAENKVAKQANKLKVIDNIVKQAAAFISKNNDLKRNLLYHSSGRPQKEKAWQAAFQCYIDATLKQHNLDITPEFNTGIGPVDFKFSDGENFKVVVEIKLSSNSKREAGLTKQLELYKNATTNVKQAYFVYVDLDDEEVGTKRINTLLTLKREQGIKSEIVIIDGRLHESASKVV